MIGQDTLFRPRVSTIYPGMVNGADIAFKCEADRGGTYYCKEDKDGRPVRATEWIGTSIARVIGIMTPDFSVIDSQDTESTYFGSLQLSSPATDFYLAEYLANPRVDETGQPSGWLGAYLAGVYVLDLFLGNWDRSRRNFLLQTEGAAARLCDFDYASSSLAGLSGLEFPIASSSTVQLGSYLRTKHGFTASGANIALDKLESVQTQAVLGILESMPSDWLGAEQKGEIGELWSTGRITARLRALRAGLANESLL